ncbi:MAG: zf-HC2 domain-containing protein [Acidobacteria bacterium]|nr:zf-HC2 domain-containing protein [Acidobacteriota bacterium]MCA1627335.1 zf-HC2 domain-containing protein [Acidobacteriota bacterium]
MNCGFTEKISSLIDGELWPAEAREVERHLLTCVRCAEARADFLSLRSQISSFEASLPGVVQKRALAKILAGGRGERKTSGAGVSWGWNWGYAAAALASIAFIGLIIGLMSFSQRPDQVAFNAPPSVPSPTVEPSPETKSSPEAEPPKADKNEKEDTPKPKATPARRPPVREPKPGEQFASIPEPAIPETIRSADAQTMTALHFEKAENLLRAFRNVRLDDTDAAAEVRYERKRAQQLIYQNMMLRREADAAGDVQIASLLDSLEPILLDIANLPDRPDEATVRVIRERVERKNIVALLQINSTALARALD